MAQTYNLTIAALIFLVGTAGLVSGASAEDVETTNALTSADALDDSDEERYNCLTREVWSEEKQAWCDEYFMPDQFEPEVVVCVLPVVEEKTNLEKVGDFIGSIVAGIADVIGDIFDYDGYNIYRSTNQTNSIDIDDDEPNEVMPIPEDYDSYNIYRSTNQTN